MMPPDELGVFPPEGNQALGLDDFAGFIDELQGGRSVTAQIDGSDLHRQMVPAPPGYRHWVTSKGGGMPIGLSTADFQSPRIEPIAVQGTVAPVIAY